MPKYYSILDNGVAKPMASNKMSKKTGPGKADFRPGGSYSTGRAIPLGIPGAKKKKAMTGSKEKRSAGPSVGRSQRSNKGAQVRTRSKY